MIQEQPWTKATIVIASDALLDHDPSTEIIVAAH